MEFAVKVTNLGHVQKPKVCSETLVGNHDRTGGEWTRKSTPSLL